MKSNKARKIIADNLRYSECLEEYVISPKTAAEAVNVAETDLIEKAINSYCWVLCYHDRSACEACVAKSIFVAKLKTELWVNEK